MGGRIYLWPLWSRLLKGTFISIHAKAREDLGSISVGSQGEGILKQTTHSGFSSASLFFFFVFLKVGSIADKPLLCSLIQSVGVD